MIEEKIIKIANKIKKYGEYLSDGASSEEIEIFKKWVGNRFGDIDISQYIDLVRITNGLEYNGLVIYTLNNKSKESIYRNNLIWHENSGFENYLFYADESISWYCFDVVNRVFYELDKPSGDIMKSFETFNDMICEAFDCVL